MIVIRRQKSLDNQFRVAGAGISQIRRNELGYGDADLSEPRDGRCKTVPSPERIRELCAQIRKSWTTRERRRRAGLVRYVELFEMPLQTRRKGFWGD